MKTKSVSILFVFVSLKSIAQFEYIEQTELYKKYNITEVTAYFHDSTLVEEVEVWKINSNGQLVYRELLPVDGDSSLSTTILEYENHLLLSQKSIGVWNIKTNKIDTAHVQYYYDNNGNVVKEQHIHTKDQDTLIKDYQYLNGLLISTRLYNQDQSFWFVVDSTVYYPSTIPKLKSTVKFYNKSPEYKKELFFDTQGVLQSEIEYSFDRKIFNPVKIKIFIYNNEKLIRIKEVLLGTNFTKKVYTYEKVYEYDNKGLLSKQLRLQGGTIINFDT